MENKTQICRDKDGDIFRVMLLGESKIKRLVVVTLVVGGLFLRYKLSIVHLFPTCLT